MTPTLTRTTPVFTRCSPLTVRRTRLLLLACVVSLAALTGWADGATTVHAVGALDATEVNPLAAASMDAIGLEAAALWFTLGWTAWVAAMVVAAFGSRIRAVRDAVVVSLVLVLTGKVLVVASNLLVIAGS